MKPSCRTFAIPVLAALLSMSGPAPAAPATVEVIRSIMPPPGLYRLEPVHGGAPQQGAARADEAAGNGALASQANTRPAGSRPPAPGADDAPQTTCIGPSTDLAPLLQRGSCTLLSSALAGGEVVTTSECFGAKVIAAIGKTGAATWQIRSRSIVGAPSFPLPGGDPYRVGLAYAARNAPTAAERSEAAEELATYDRQTNARQAGRARAGRASGTADGAGVVEVRKMHVLTRVAPSCRP